MADKNLEPLKRKRTELRKQTTKLFTKIKDCLENQNLSNEERFDLLNIYKDQLNEKYDSLKLLNADIQNITADADFEKEIESSENYSEKVIEWRYKITKFLNEYIAKNQTAAFQNPVIQTDSSTQNIRAVHNVKLPKLSIGKFYGDSSLWLEFWGQFSNAVDQNPNLTPIDKFSYLKSLLGGNASSVVAGFSLSEETYKEAVDLLKSRFGRNDIVINAHMTKLLNLKPVKSSANINELRSLYDNCEIQIRNLNALGVTSGSYGNLLCPILLKLIPPDLALDFNRKKTKGEEMKVEELISFIKEEVESRESTLQLNYSENSDNYKKENINKIRTM